MRKISRRKFFKLTAFAAWLGLEMVGQVEASETEHAEEFTPYHYSPYFQRGCSVEKLRQKPKGALKCSGYKGPEPAYFEPLCDDCERKRLCSIWQVRP